MSQLLNKSPVHVSRISWRCLSAFVGGHSHHIESTPSTSTPPTHPIQILSCSLQKTLRISEKDRNQTTVVPNNLPQSSNSFVTNFDVRSLNNVFPIGLPGVDRNSKIIYTFPTVPRHNSIKIPVIAPTISPVITEINDPLVRSRIIDPDWNKKGEIQAKRYQIGSGTSRHIIQRRRKVKKHQRKKREKKNIYRIVSMQQRKKNASERVFRARCSSIIQEAMEFDAEDYVKRIIERSEKMDLPLTPAGRTKHPHWRELMDIEELYGVPPSTHIDKRAGLPGDEDAEAIREKKKQYFSQYRTADN